MSTERPTPETYACIVTSAGKFDCLYPDSKIWRLPVPAGFAAKLERERDEVREHVTRLCQCIATTLAYPRGSEAQVRCLEEIGQDAAYILKNLKP
jgi:hypothetical protein